MVWLAAHAAGPQAGAVALPVDEPRVLVRDPLGHRLELAEHGLQPAQAAGVVGDDLPGELDGRGLGQRGGRGAVQEPDRQRLLRADDAAGEDELLGAREPDERDEPGRPDGRAHPRAGPHEAEVVAADAQVAARGDLRAGPDDVAHADRHRRDLERVEGGVDAREGLHPRNPAGVVEHLRDVGPRAQRARIGRRDDERADGLLELGELGAAEGVAGLRAVEPQHLDPVVEALGAEAAHAAGFSRIRGTMKRVLSVLPAALAAVLLLAPAALAHDGGQGTYGETNDKVITDAGFILIAFFPLFIFTMSMILWVLDRRKERRKSAHKKVEFHGGW